MLFVFAVSAFAQIFFWIAIWIGIRRADGEKGGNTPPGGSRPVSVIVAVRDGGEILPELLDALAHQDHSVFEVVVVDDGSNDRSSDLVSDWRDGDPRFRLVENPVDRSGKKGAVSTGIGEARHDLIALTDADCRPGRGWLSAVARAHGESAAIVVGYGPYSREKSILNSLIRYETFATAMMTAGAIGLGYPYMAVGRNLSYPKEVAVKLHTRARGQVLLSGDDDLFVQEASHSGFGVRYLICAQDFSGLASPEAPTPERLPVVPNLRHHGARGLSRIIHTVLDCAACRRLARRAIPGCKVCGPVADHGVCGGPIRRKGSRLPPPAS